MKTRSRRAVVRFCACWILKKKLDPTLCSRPVVVYVSVRRSCSPRVVWITRRWTLANFGRSHRTNRFLLVVIIIYFAYYMHVRAHSVVVLHVYVYIVYRVSGIYTVATWSEEYIICKEGEETRMYTFKRIMYKRVSPPPHVSDVFICVINKTFFLYSPFIRFFLFLHNILFSRHRRRRRRVVSCISRPRVGI